MRGGLKIARLFGIDVFVHWTFSLLIAFIIFRGVRAEYSAQELVWSVLFILLLFFIVVLHELGHSLTARRFGIPTRNITLLPIGGVASLEKMPEKPKEELLVALAGPLVNVVLAIVLYFFISIPSEEILVDKMSEPINPGNIVLYLFIVNIILAVFNMIPAFPMDGGRVLRAMLSIKIKRHKATVIAARIGQVLAVFFIIGGFYGNPFLILIGLFIIFGAQAEAQHTKTNYMLKGATLSDVLMQNYETLQSSDSIKVAIQKLLDGQSKNFLVLDENNYPVGTLDRESMIKSISENGVEIDVASCMNADLLKFRASTEVESAYREMQTNNISLALIYENEEFIGIVDSENILEYIMLQSALDK